MKAENEKEKHEIEKPTMGVHVWLPRMRGAAFTKKFTEKHPIVIEKHRKEIEDRINLECKQFNIK